jgi:uncharacterized protein YbbC (DUF1343 family)
VQILITDRKAIEPLEVGFELAGTLRRLYPDKWQHERYRRLLGDDAVWRAVDAGESRREIQKAYVDELEPFRVRRAAFLLY